jgi:hypothetical protein
MSRFGLRFQPEGLRPRMDASIRPAQADHRRPNYDRPTAYEYQPAQGRGLQLMTA